MSRGDGFVKARKYQRKGGATTRWVARVDLGPGIDGEGRRLPRIIEERQFATRGEAKEWRAKKTAELRTTHPMIAERRARRTIRSILDEHLAYGATLGDWSPSHLSHRRWMVEHELRPLHHILADEITVGDVEVLLERRQRDGLSSASLQHIRMTLSAALNFAIRRENLPPGRNVAQLARSPAVRREPPKVIPPAEIPAFVAALADERHRTLLLTAMTLALRPSEAIGLRWTEVDLARAEVTIKRSVQYIDGRFYERERPKDDEARVIAIPDFLVQALRSHKLEQLEEREPETPRPTRSSSWEYARWERRQRARREQWLANKDRWDGLVFTSEDGRPVNSQHLHKRLKAIIDRINESRISDAALQPVELIPRITLYQLRHTGATWMMSSGIPEYEVQSIMGHASADMTRRYAQVLQPQRRAAAERLDSLMRGMV